jgi:glycosidase
VVRTADIRARLPAIFRPFNYRSSFAVFAIFLFFGTRLPAQDFKKQVIYQIITDRFYDGDTSNDNPPQSPGLYDASKTNWQAYWGGDIAGIQAKLAYIKGMGATAIWISPPVDNINQPMMGTNGKPVPYLFAPYHGYINRDFMRIEEHFGDVHNTWKAFDSLIAAAHEQHIKVIVDFSPNDSNLTYTAAHGALYDNGKLLGTYAYDTKGLFHHNGPLTDWNNIYQLQYYNVFRLADLNEDNPQIDRYIKKSMHQFQDHEVDAFRLDAAKHITWGWAYSLANSVYSYKPSFIFAEWFIVGTHDKLYKETCKYANQSGMSILDYPLAMAIRDVFANDKDFSEIENTLNTEDHDFKRPNDLVTFTDNHDIPRLLTLNNNKNRLNEATAFVLTSRGIPIVYYGDEQYLHNDTDGGKDPYNRVWMSTYDTNTTGYKLVRRLSALRQANDALAYGTIQSRFLTPNAFVFERHFANDTVLVAINKSENTATSIPSLMTTLAAGTYKDYLDGLMNGSTITVANSPDASKDSSHENAINKFILAPHSIAVWQLAGPSTKPKAGSIGPSVGQPGMQITIAGEHFGSARGSILFNEKNAPIHSWSDNQVVLTVPMVPNGDYNVKLKEADGKSANPVNFRVLQARLIPVTFTVDGVPSTFTDESLYLTGNTIELGQWATTREAAIGPFLCPHAPTCFLDISVPTGKLLHFKFLNIAHDGSITKESGENYSFTVPSTGTGSVQVEWQH